MMHEFMFCMPTKVYFGAGMSKKISQMIHGVNVLIISDPFLYETGVAIQIGDSLEGKNVFYFTGVEPNPSCESVDAATLMARNIHADCIIGLGGGSSLDITKMVSCLVTNEGSIYDYYGSEGRKLTKRSTTLICIPTTAGTGSEVTNVGVYTNKKAGKKMPMVTDDFWPDIAVIDAELTYTLPKSMTSSTGMDAFCHAIEAYWNKNSQPMCDALAVEAMKLILNNIKAAYDEADNKEARAAMIKASLLAGVAFSQTRTTGIHALSFPLTTEFGANHGTACSITLPAFIKVSKEEAEEKMMNLVRYLGYSTIEEFADAIEKLMQSMKMPVRLHEIGVKETDISHITEVGLGAAIIQLTPATMNNETVSKLLLSIL